MSRWLYRHRLRRLAKAVKAVNFVLNSTLVPFQATVGADLRLGHHGLGMVIHPNTVIGDRVTVWHHVTIAAETPTASPQRVYIGDDVMLGAGCVIVGRGGRDLRIGTSARVGAGAVVTRDVPPGAVVVGSPARPVGHVAWRAVVG